MLPIELPTVRLEGIPDERPVKSAKSVRSLLNEFKKVRSQHDDDPKTVIDRSRTKGDHRDRLPTLYATIEQTCGALTAACRRGARAVRASDSNLSRAHIRSVG